MKEGENERMKMTWPPTTATEGRASQRDMPSPPWSPRTVQALCILLTKPIKLSIVAIFAPTQLPRELRLDLFVPNQLNICNTNYLFLFYYSNFYNSCVWWENGEETAITVEAFRGKRLQLLNVIENKSLVTKLILWNKNLLSSTKTHCFIQFSSVLLSCSLYYK